MKNLIIEDTSAKLISALKVLYLNDFVNENIEQLQKIKTTYFMKLTVVIARQTILIEFKFTVALSYLSISYRYIFSKETYPISSLLHP